MQAALEIHQRPRDETPQAQRLVVEESHGGLNLDYGQRPRFALRLEDTDCEFASGNELLDEHALGDPLAKEIIESQSGYLAQSRAWTTISDLAYLNSLDD